jgi:signal transduction histidine kinase
VAQLGLNNLLDEAAPDPRISASRDALDQGIEEVRRLGHDLNTDLWQRRSLADAISATAERIERVGRLRTHVLVRGELPALPSDTATILFRVFQEVVQNAVKHSGADTLSITLNAGPPFVLSVADNGRGFDAANTTGNNGLLNIRKRCALIGFNARCTSAAGTGCTWTFEQQNDHGRA